MFIQCQHCQTTYKIDESKIPGNGAFVRCAKCSNPITLSKKELSLQSGKQPQKIVECLNCNIRYSIPLEKIKQDPTKVRCGKCGHVFHVSKSTIDEDDPFTKDSLPGSFDQEEPLLSNELDAEDEKLESYDDLDLDNISIPPESEIEVDSLFDDIEQQDNQEFTSSQEDFDEQTDLDDSSLLSSESSDATHEYLESVDLSSNLDEDNEDLGISEIPSEQKYKIFLQPSSESTPEDTFAETPEDKENWPEIQDETSLEGREDNFDQDISDFTELDELSEMPELDELSEMPELDELSEMPELDETDRENLLVSNQAKSKKRGKSLFLIIVLLLILAGLAIGAWIYFRVNSNQAVFSLQTENYSSKSKLQILEPLHGKFVLNQNSGGKIFVLEGKVKSTYTEHIYISWVEIIGVLYDRQNNKLSESIAYAGVNLTNAQLEQWSQQRINSFISFQFDQKNRQLNLSSGQMIPFQIIFFTAPLNIQKLEARINRFGIKE